ncbi:hypothetical protein AC579_6684 [Pseudocercospora musae]|uniref:Major facilitator superfamily (MFS) profile domain-containing protein n=1 Tax=Pseudocercospora musae TaxID=113226 RepID=A0A139I0N0_9PEZI|nr:hypothetical protein AC579_6684 [Pseudocercospora musae]
MLERSDPEEFSPQPTPTPPPLDPKIESRIIRKLDLTLIPMLWFLFIVSFADRSNIGNAKIQGMSHDLSLTGNRYNIAVMVFTLAYVILGIPANIAFRNLGPKSLSGMMFIWGICALCQGLVRSWEGLVVCRFFLGVFEAGFVPGAAYLIGSYYKKDEFLKRYAIFFSGAIFAGAFNGLVSYALALADGAAGLAGWRWIFLVEGLLTCVVALPTFWLMPAFPEETKMFEGEEKAVLLERLRRDGGSEPTESMWTHIMAALLDWKIWLATLAYIGVEENVASVVAFLPSILKGLGFTSVSAQVHSIPIYLTAFATTLIAAYLSERLRQRYLFALFGALLNLIGLAILLAAPKAANVKYTGTFLLTAGCYVAMPILVVWNAINVGKGYKRVVSFAMTTAIGNCGAFISSNVFITHEAPGYPTGFKVGMGMNCLAILSMTVLYLGLVWSNRRTKFEGSTTFERVGSNEALSEGNYERLRYHL